MFQKPLFYLIFATCFLTLSTPLSAQETASEDASAKNAKTLRPAINAAKIGTENEIELDGMLNEPFWNRASVATGFTQRSPHDGKPATEKTEARIIYTNDAIYVGIKAYDSAMDSVAATLFRKDGSAYSDWVYVSFDSYNDDRTSFSFAVNPKGVRKDVLTFNDKNEDLRWDAVWEAETQISSNYWTAEIKIPLSQLRYSAKEIKQTWGVNFQRRIARKQEISFWSPTPQDESGLVSKFGNLNGIENLEDPSRLEIIPYASSNLTQAPAQPNNPFYKANDLSGSIGGDIKYGLTPDLTLTATINPDFGQVEADPAVINLSAFETFFPEQRPFFLEGNEIFEFGSTSGNFNFNPFSIPNTFYTRRIGRAPQGNLNQYNSYHNNNIYSPSNAEAVFTDHPDQTTIAGAAKVSGKTQGGWSIGFLDAYTVQETSPFQVNLANSGTINNSFAVEPATNYLVARTKKDFNEGNSVVGGFLSATNRNINDSYFQTFLHKSAYVSGLDFEHNWDDKNWAVTGAFSASQVNGDEEAILRTQRSPVRYYNRVDSDELSVDPTKTSLTGFATELSIRKSGGGNWRTSATYSQVSPGYETNDLGFQNRAGYRAVATSLIYRETSPEFFRFYNIWSMQSFAWNQDGDIIANNYNLGGYWQFKNLWSFNANINYSGSAFMDRLTRGGPIAKKVPTWNFNVNINSDQTKKISFNVGTFNRWDFPPAGVIREYDHVFWAGIEIRPATNVQIDISPQFNIQRDNDQYVTRISDPLAADTYGSRYVFADIDRTTISTNFRVDWTFNPDMSLQFYARPFVTAGDFYNYKEFTTPRELDFDIYGMDTGSIEKNNGIYTVDPDGAGSADTFSFSDRDFNFRSIQTNAVFRWEYKPGSALFLVWQQDRRSSDRLNNFNFQRDFSGLFASEPTNVFLIKLSYWFSS